MKQSTAIKLILDEIELATKNHGKFNSAHEAYAVILEELDELWVEIKANNSASHRATSEAVQVAAMALRYLVDISPDETAKEHTTKVEKYVSTYTSSGGFTGIGGYSG